MISAPEYSAVPVADRRAIQVLPLTLPVPTMTDLPGRPRPSASVEAGGGAGTRAARGGLPEVITPGHRAAAFVHPELAAEQAVLGIEHFELYYGKTRALQSVSMSVPERRVTALIGPSGCGKTTLLRSINRMNDLIDGVRVQGKVRLRGRDLYDRSVDVIDLRRRVGMVFQKPNPFPMSMFDNAVYGLRIAGERRGGVLGEACERALRAAALWDEAKDRLRDSALTLSGGQQQRLCIARAIAVEPEVLLMDEPCSALDPIATLKIEELIYQISERFTVLMVTHNMQQAARVSHFTAFMYMGRLVEYGPTAKIFQTPALPETEQYVTGRFG